MWSGACNEASLAVSSLGDGDVFELGCGGGLNQEFYQTSLLSSFSGIDPHPGLLEIAKKRATDRGLQSTMLEGSGEDIPFSSASFDSVVCTFTLCSVGDPKRVMSEMRQSYGQVGVYFFLSTVERRMSKFLGGNIG